MDYENDHKKYFCLSVILELKVENGTILTLKVIFLYQKIGGIFLIFFSLKNINRSGTLAPEAH